MPAGILGIVGAMPEEVDGVTELLTGRQVVTIGKRDYHSGKLNNQDAVVVFSRWGKVAAAATVTTLILNFGVTEIVFTGVAGALQPELNIGDIVVAQRLIQHDMDAGPLMPEFEVPLLGLRYFTIQQEQVRKARAAVESLLQKQHLAEIITAEELRRFSITQPKLYLGDIASGDKFVTKHEDKQRLLDKLPSVLCVEMEGAAVAQVCYEYGVPCTIVRTISDTANEQAAVDFPAFVRTVANKYSMAIVKNIVQKHTTLG